MKTPQIKPSWNFGIYIGNGIKMDEKQSGDYFGDEDAIEAERIEIEENNPKHERNADDEEDV